MIFVLFYNITRKKERKEKKDKKEN